jgi:hypothetical protein
MLQDKKCELTNCKERILHCFGVVFKKPFAIDISVAEPHILAKSRRDGISFR